MVKAIVAVGPNNLIGNGDKMPWYLPEELKFFKKTTFGHSLLVGGTTFRGLPNKLPNRFHYVYTRGNDERADRIINSCAEAIDLLKNFRQKSEETLFIIGGKKVYEEFLGYADEIIVSEVNTSNSGDVYLNWDFKPYRKEKIYEGKDFVTYSYKK